MFTLLNDIVDLGGGLWLGTPRRKPNTGVRSPRRAFRPALEALEDRMAPSATAQPTTTEPPPVVISTLASGPTKNTLSTIKITFSESIVPSTFTAADLSLLGPKSRVAIKSVTPVSGTNDKTFTIAFAEQTAPGSYTLYVGSNAKNAARVSLKNYQTAFKITAAATPPAAPPSKTGSNPTNFVGTLTPGQTLYSPNREYYLVLQGDGNLVEYNATGTPLWASGTNGQTVTKLTMQSNGDLLLFDGAKVIWSSGTSGYSNACLSVENNGTIVIYSGSTLIWGAYPTLLPNGSLLPGQTLSSPNAAFYVVLQGDGNLVEYTSTGTPLWDSRTGGHTVTKMTMESNGALVLLDGATVVWSTGTYKYPGAHLSIQNNGTLMIYWGSTSIWAADLALNQNTILLAGQILSSPNGAYYLTLQSDGNLVEYTATGTAVWSSGTSGQAVTEIVMQGDGNLVVRDGAAAVWSTGTYGYSGAYLSVGDDGTIAINWGGTTLWTN
jgi:hypothetical protein